MVYGNRDIEDALLEFKLSLDKQGFISVAAAVCLAEHCIFPAVAAGRPDAADEDEQSGFGRQVVEKVKGLASSPLAGALRIPGEFPYRKPVMHGIFTPQTDDSCIMCGLCVDVCPANAISEDTPNLTDGELCLTCMACVKVCPENSRQLTGDAFVERQKLMQDNFGNIRKQSQFML